MIYLKNLFLIQFFLVSLLISTSSSGFVSPVCKNGYWTQYFDRDNPSVTGDYETLREICSKYPGKACSRPTAIDVRAVSTGKDYRFYKQNVKVSPTIGFACVNKNQANGKQCLDYKVRFCCPSTWYHWGSWSSCSRTCGTGYQCRRRSCKGSKCTGSSLQTKSCTIQKSCTILPPVCKNGYWTQCFDRDNPSVTGDYETLREICFKYPGKACSRPTAIDVRAVSTGKDYRLYKQNVKVSPTFGFACVNKNQANGKQCLDYKVRFCCPKP